MQTHMHRRWYSKLASEFRISVWNKYYKDPALLNTPWSVIKGLPPKKTKDILFASLPPHSELISLYQPLNDSQIKEPIHFYPPLESDREVAETAEQLIDETSISQAVWHSTSHILGASLESKWGDEIMLENGPAMEHDGFFYDSLITKAGPRHVESVLEFIQNHQNEENLSSKLLSQYPSQLYKLFNTEKSNIISFSESDLHDIQKSMRSFVSNNSDTEFQFMSIPRNVAVEMFAMNPFKLRFISSIPESDTITVYKCGEFIDLCKGPHIHRIGQIQGLKLLKTGACQYNFNNATAGPLKIQGTLSRVYGISFPTKNELTKWEQLQLEASKRDHRLIGKNQALFTLHAFAPGSAMMLPHGTRIINKILHLLRMIYKKNGYDEVVTPLVFNKELWEMSGHWENYRDDMFMVGSSEKQEIAASDLEETVMVGNEKDELHGLKPMNCPGHCLIFGSTVHSYRDLPVRYAEFSPLHRNEASGALTGLTRVRRFHQDDAHIFCTFEQVKQEINSTLALIDKMYLQCFGFKKYTLALSTRPESNFLGDVEDWDKAEGILKDSLVAFVENKRADIKKNEEGEKDQKEEVQEVGFTIRNGDGAFYGPKIDILVTDALSRQHQLGTIQLDFQLPSRFNLKYATEQGTFDTPILIHRAILGSVERMLAVLIEHYGGRWPFWLNPRQMMVINVSKDQQPYALNIVRQLKTGIQSGDSSFLINDESKSFYADLDDSDRSLSKRIREAQINQYNFILVVGEREVENNTVSVRSRDGKDLGEMDIKEAIDFFDNLELNFN